MARRVPELVDAVVELHARAPAMHRVLFEETPLPSALRAELAALEDGLAAVVAKALEAAPDLALADPRLTARVVVDTIESLTHRLVLRPPTGVSTEAVAREITALVSRYVGG